MKKYLLILLIIIFLTGISFAKLGEKEFIKAVDVDGDGKKEEIYTEIKAEGASIHKKLIVLKKGMDIFPKRYPDIYEFKSKIGEPFFTYFGSFGGYGIEKFDNNIPGLQIIIFQRGYAYRIDGKKSSCWQKTLTDLAEGKLIKRVFVEGNLFKYDKNKNEFVFYRKDYVEYLSNKIPKAEEIVKMFLTNTRFTQAYNKACLILDLMKQNRIDEVRKFVIRNIEIDTYLKEVERGDYDLSKSHLASWCSKVDENGYQFDGCGLRLNLNRELKLTSVLIFLNYDK